MDLLGRVLTERQKWDEAEANLRRCLAVREKTQPDDWSTFDTRSSLGGCLLHRAAYADAEPLIIGGYEGMKAREARTNFSAGSPPQTPRGRRADRSTVPGMEQARSGGGVEGQARPRRPAGGCLFAAVILWFRGPRCHPDRLEAQLPAGQRHFHMIPSSRPVTNPSPNPPPTL